MLSSPLPCYLILLRFKYLPQHPILEHPQPMFLPQCDRPSFTPTQNNTGTILQDSSLVGCDVSLGNKRITVEPGHNDIGLCDASSITSDRMAEEKGVEENAELQQTRHYARNTTDI
jgi:hypothetical protein